MVLGSLRGFLEAASSEKTENFALPSFGLLFSSLISL